MAGVLIRRGNLDPEMHIEGDSVRTQGEDGRL